MRLKLERPLAFFDLETTGTQIGRDRIVQIGIVTLLADGTRVAWESLVQPGIPIPPEATEVHGINDLDVAAAPSLQDVAPTIISQLSNCDLAGFNCLRFDVPFLAEEIHRIGMVWDHSALRIIDVQRIYHQLEPRNLSAALRHYCDRELEGAHNALIDVQATADVLLAQLERHKDKLEGSVDFLASLSGDRQRSPDPGRKLMYDDSGTVCLAFGKYRGWALERIGRSDPGYMQWLMLKADLPPSTLSIMRNVLAEVDA